MDSFEAYKIGQCITKGQLSEVYQATHIESGTVVALKRIKIFDMHPAMRKECETEVGLLQSLDHAHLIKYYTHFAHDGDLYVVMEHASGGTLAQKVEAARTSGSPIEERLLWRWLYDAASALAYLHRRRVLHRDVKPSHIFLGEGNQAKLGDFGLSKAMSTKTLCAFSCVGTPFYMSPEIVKGDGYSFGSDVWSLGCTLYELATGYPPFYRKDMDFYALGDAICSARYPALSAEAWSCEFVDLVSEILAVEAADRPDAQRILDVAGCRVCRMDAARIQDFQIMGTIGRGKFSEVHRSLWKAGGNVEVALKRVQIFDMDSEARRECNAEVNLLKSLDHPAIIRYLDSFIEASELVIVLELAPHGDLANVCRQLKQDGRVLEESQIWAVVMQVCDALSYMHEHRVMHRDIKPANIFMCADGVVKLGDLGLGRYFSSNTYRAHSVVGTPFYMSPEVITSGGGYSFKSDIWSLGCVLYELAALSSPFASSRLNYYALGNKISTGQYPPLPGGTPPRVRSLCAEMIQVKRDARPDASAVLDTTRRHFAQSSVQASETDTTSELARATIIVKGMLSAPCTRGCPGSPSGAALVGLRSNAKEEFETPSASVHHVLSTASSAAASAIFMSCDSGPASAPASHVVAAASGIGSGASSLGPPHTRSGWTSEVNRSTVGVSGSPAGGAFASVNSGGSSSGNATAGGGVVCGDKVPQPYAKRISLPPAVTSRDATVASTGGNAGGAGGAGGLVVSQTAQRLRPVASGPDGRRPTAPPSGSLSARCASWELDRYIPSSHGPGGRRAPSPSPSRNQVSPLRMAGQLAGGSASAHSDGWKPGNTGAAPTQQSQTTGLPPIQRFRESPQDAFAEQRGSDRHAASSAPHTAMPRAGNGHGGGGHRMPTCPPE
eukprot:TRINITY_DN43290_c0_g1_i1.p1 TRINITY_DN43290_c0_g1~~TRINITY_DN43290_c0_g1_i1.p1  ORF type:complete len:895 (-),score=151.55 TRINITY_DN43290_c0_g1_i1:93-2777(-)